MLVNKMDFFLAYGDTAGVGKIFSLVMLQNYLLSNDSVTGSIKGRLSLRGNQLGAEGDKAVSTLKKAQYHGT